MGEARPSLEGLRIAVFSHDGTGHLNPQLALVDGLVKRGAVARFYLLTEKNKANIEAFGMRFKGKITINILDQLSNAHNFVTPVSSQSDSDKLVSDIVLASAGQAVAYMEKILQDFEDFKPDFIIYDPFELVACLAAEIKGLPSVTTITVPNFNSYPILAGLVSDDEWTARFEDHLNSQTLQRIGAQFKDRHGFDPLNPIFTVPMSCYHPRGLPLCTGLRSFQQRMPSVIKDKIPSFAKLEESCVYVGPMLLSTSAGRISSQEASTTRHPLLDEPFPHDDLAKYKGEGRKIIYISFGTVSTSPYFWDFQGPPTKMYGARNNGKTFCRTLWQHAFEAFGDKNEYGVVVATCTPSADALDGFEIPKNFIVRRRCPQLDVLKDCQVFFTHAGANSLMESIAEEVPMIALPWFSDQFENARLVTQLGVGLHHENPVAEITPRVMLEDVEKILNSREAYAERLRITKEQFKEAGGVPKAIEAIEEYLRGFKRSALHKKSYSETFFSK